MPAKNKSYPHNVIVNDFPEKDDEDESLKDIYQELDLAELTMVVIDARGKDHSKKQPSYPPYGGELLQLKGLNKGITFLEMKEKVSIALRWPVNQFRLWDQTQYEEFMTKNYDPFNRSAYRDHIPHFVDLEENEVMFPLFLTGQYIVVERIRAVLQKFPKSPKPERFDRDSWNASLRKEWKGVSPEVNKTVYRNIEIIRMERNERSNTLFNALGYQLHVLSNVKGEDESDEMKDGLTQPSRYRSARIKKYLAGFVADNSEALLESGLLEEYMENGLKENSVMKYFKALFDPFYSGGDLELTLISMMSRSLIQIFDVKSKQMLQYGKGFVEYSGNPDRLSSRFATKLVRWADHSYDPLNFSLQHGMDPDRHEMPFCNAYVELAFNWVDTIAPDAIRNTVTCAKCYKNDEAKKQMVCKDCRLAFYCGRRCQILHWNEAHKAVCQKRDFKKESINNFEQEKTAFSSVIIELSDRMNGKRGIKKLIKMAENDFDGIEGVPEKEVAGIGDQEVNVLREEPVEGLFDSEDEKPKIVSGKIDMMDGIQEIN